MKHASQLHKVTLLVLLLLLAFSTFGLDSSTLAYAHASLVRAEPGEYQVLPAAPNRVSLWFTEPLEPEFSGIEVLDTSGQRVDRADSSVNPSDPTNMTVNLKSLMEGIYTVNWRNLSAVDGHRLSGVYVFSVGVAITGQGAQRAGSDEGPLLPSPFDPLIRWMLFIGLLAVVGGSAFDLLIIVPAFVQQTRNEFLRETGRIVLGRSHAALFMATVVAAIASLLQLLLQNSIVYESGFLDMNPSHIIRTAMQTGWGNAWTWRMCLLVAALVWVRYGQELTGIWKNNRTDAEQENGSQSRLELPVVLLLGLGALFTVSMSSHAAATSDLTTVALLNDALHLTAASFWVGGLVHFAIGIPVVLRTLPAGDRREALSALTPRFSLVAGLSVVTLLGTGAFSGWAQVTALQAMQTPYGFALGVKVIVVLALLAIGATNLLLIGPELQRNDQAGLWLHRAVRAEVALAAVVLFATGFLTTLEPARQVASRLGLVKTGVERQMTVETTRLVLNVTPASVGANKLALTLHDLVGNPITNATDVVMTISPVKGDLAPTLLTVSNTGDGQYTVDNALLTIVGDWAIDVQVRRPDAFDTRAGFQVGIAPPAGSGSGEAAIYPSTATGKLLWGIQLSVLGFLFLAIGVFVGGWRARRSATTMGLGMTAVLAGLVFTGGTLAEGESTVKAGGPPPVTEESIRLGKLTFENNCIPCHGQTGHGDGPLAASLNPKPQDLAVHLMLHSDRDLFNFIKNGVPGTAMPIWGQRLSDDEIWQALYYIQSFLK